MTMTILISTPKDMALEVPQYLLNLLAKCATYRDNRDGTYTPYGFALKVAHLLDGENEKTERPYDTYYDY